MAALQRRSGSYPLLFQYDGKQQALTIGDVTLVEARQWKGKAEHLLMRLKQRLLEVPLGCTITDFILHDGKPPLLPNLTKSKNTTLDQLRAAYVKVFSNGAIEANTLAAAKIHLDHIESTFGKTFLLPALTRWECLYLDAMEEGEFLDFAKAANVRDYLYPMLVMAGHTGARRSEMMRARVEDVDLANAIITLREKKRARGTYTSRRSAKCSRKS